MSDQKLRELEERILKLEKKQAEIYRSRKGLIVEPALNILGQNTKINGDLEVNGNITLNSYLVGQWQDWTPTVTGWSSETLKLMRYAAIGKVCFVNVRLDGTSNSTDFYSDLPFTAASFGSQFAYFGNAIAIDNGSVKTSPGSFRITPNAASVYYFPNIVGGYWTPSGRKLISGLFFYEAE